MNDDKGVIIGHSIHKKNTSECLSPPPKKEKFFLKSQTFW